MVVAVSMPVIMVMVSGMVRLGAPRKRCEEGAALAPGEGEPEQHDHAVGAEFEEPHGVVHRLGAGAEHERGDADERDRGDGLGDRGGEGKHDPAFHRRVVGDEIGRDYRLAVAGARRVKNAVEKR